MVSIIICSIRKELRDQLKRNIIETIGLENYEIIVVENETNSYSIAAAYNMAAKSSLYSYLCFIHEDIIFHVNNWGQILLKYLQNHEISLVGILGCTIKTKAPSGVFTNIKQLNRINQYQRYPNGRLIHYYENPRHETYSEVSVLDGIFLACSKNNWQKTLFDENELRGFHGYDLDFSLAQQENGKVVVVYDISVEHISFGGNTTGWIDAQLYVSKKWKAALPLIKEVDASRKLVFKAEVENLNQFLVALFKNKYKLNTARRIFIGLLLKRPLQRLNLFFAKHLLLSLATRNTKNGI